MIKVFEMFAGFGGASFSLQKAGIEFQTVGYSEIDKSAIKIFDLNHPEIKNFGDCRNINLFELPDFDLLTAGFPCQPFSINTKHTVRGKEHKGYNLFKDILRIVSFKKPTYLLLENVRGILGEKSKEVLDTLLTSLKDEGYGIKQFEANSRNFGIPQNRERVYFIGKLGGWPSFEFPKEEPLKLNIKDILEKGDVERRKPAIMNYYLAKLPNIEKFGKITRFEAIMKNPVSKRNSNVKYEILDAPSDSVSRQNDRIYDINYSPCLTATGKDYVFEVDGEIITLTPKECFRLMGFLDDEIKLDGILENQKYKLAGNGWDIHLVSLIFKQMFEPTSKIELPITPLIQKPIVQLNILPELKRPLTLEQKKEKLINMVKEKLSSEEFWLYTLMLNDIIKN